MESIKYVSEENQKLNENYTTLITPEKKNKQEYQYGLDLVRFIAMFLVISVHATTFNNFMNTVIDSYVLFLSGMGRYISYTCCPLFMMLTGYLNKNKKPTLSYYSKIISFIIEYLLCSSIIVIFRVKYLKEKFTAQQLIDGFFRFSNAPYSWYINMYIGFFLLSPYLNILYNNIQTIEQKYTLIIISVIIFSLTYTYYVFGWNFWTNAYPLMYYFIGCFFREYQPKVKKIYLIIWIILEDIIQTLNRKYSKLIVVECYQNLGCVILSCLIFLLFYDFRAKRKNCFLKIFRKITDTSLSCFLLSYIFDRIFAIEIFGKKGLKLLIDRLPYLLFTVQINFIGSIIGGLITHNISLFLTKSLIFIYYRIKECLKK